MGCLSWKCETVYLCTGTFALGFTFLKLFEFEFEIFKPEFSEFAEPGNAKISKGPLLTPHYAHSQYCLR